MTTVIITAVHLVGGENVQHIAEVAWLDPSDMGIGNSSRETMVDWIDNKNGRAVVADQTGSVDVETVHPSYSHAYLRTKPDNRNTDNLLSLPRY